MCKFIGQFIANCSLEEHSNKASKHVTIPQVYLQVNFPVNLQIKRQIQELGPVCSQMAERDVEVIYSLLIHVGNIEHALPLR